jgi:hypothetical protein
MTSGMAILEIRGIIRSKWEDNTLVPGAKITETRNIYAQYRSYFPYLESSRRPPVRNKQYLRALTRELVGWEAT